MISLPDKLRILDMLHVIKFRPRYLSLFRRVETVLMQQFFATQGNVTTSSSSYVVVHWRRGACRAGWACVTAV